MEGVGWFLSIILGGLAGYIAEKIMKADISLLMNIVLGIVGAMVANFLLSLVGIQASGGIPAQLIVAVMGACLLIYVYRMIKGRS
jgi:uncharacterized membrane protein YeaQ/YmgE (transglycosylase-associated protein family)